MVGGCGWCKSEFSDQHFRADQNVLFVVAEAKSIIFHSLDIKFEQVASKSQESHCSPFLDNLATDIQDRLFQTESKIAKYVFYCECQDYSQPSWLNKKVELKDQEYLAEIEGHDKSVGDKHIYMWETNTDICGRQMCHNCSSSYALTNTDLCGRQTPIGHVTSV